MKPLDVLTAPWAIQPAKLLEIQAIYAAQVGGIDGLDLQQLGRLDGPGRCEYVERLH